MTLYITGFFLVLAFCAWNTRDNKHSISSWIKLNGSDGRDISVNDKGEFHLVNSVGKLYIYVGPNWKLMDEKGGKKTYAENVSLKAMIRDNYLYTYQRHPVGQPGNRKWILDWGMPGGPGYAKDVRDVAIDIDSAFWYIDYSGKINKWFHHARFEVPGSDGARIAAGGGQVWLVNTVGKIYRYKNPRDVKAGWEQIPGTMARDITVTNDGQVFMVNRFGTIFQRKSNQWVKLDGSDGYAIAANQGKIALVNTEGEIYTRNY